MSIVSVDLAMKQSAACVLDDYGNVVAQVDSWRLSEDEFLGWITDFWEVKVHAPDVLVIEDLPFAVPFMKITKKVCKLQGRIEEKMFQQGALDKILYLPPAVWLRSYGIKTTKDAAKLVQPKALELGYKLPIDYTEFKGTDRQLAKKTATDFCSAWLIGKWAFDYYKEHGTYDAPQTSRVS